MPPSPSDVPYVEWGNWVWDEHHLRWVWKPAIGGTEYAEAK